MFAIIALWLGMVDAFPAEVSRQAALAWERERAPSGEVWRSGGVYY